MTVTWRACPHCATLIPNSDAPASPLTHCPVCRAVLPASHVGSPQGVWFYARDKQKIGPLGLERLQQFASAGQLRRSDMVLQEGTKQWVAASSVAGLFSGHQAVAQTALPPAPASTQSLHPSAATAGSSAQGKTGGAMRGKRWLRIAGSILLLIVTAAVGVWWWKGLAKPAGATTPPRVELADQDNDRQSITPSLKGPQPEERPTSPGSPDVDAPTMHPTAKGNTTKPDPRPDPQDAKEQALLVEVQRVLDGIDDKSDLVVRVLKPFLQGDLAVARAKAGDLKAALHTIEGIEKPLEKTWALADVVRALADGKDEGSVRQVLTTAVKAVQGMPDDDPNKVRAMSVFAGAQARVGDASGARRTVELVPAACQDDAARQCFTNQTLAFVAVGFAERGEVDEAVTTALPIDKNSLFMDLVEVALTKAYAKKGDWASARLAMLSTTAAFRKVAAAAELAQIQAQNGDRAAADRSLQFAAEVMGGEERPTGKLLELQTLATARARMGEIDSAVQTVAAMDEVQAAGILKDGFLAQTWAVVGLAQARTRNRDAAEGSFQKARTAAARITDEQESTTLNAVAAAQAEAGAIEDVMKWAGDIRSPILKARILLGAAEGLRNRQMREKEQPAAGSAAPKEVANSLGMKLVVISAGKFLMGSPKGEEGRYDDEGPQHEVEITKPFYMGAYPVTVGQFRAFVKDDGYKTEAEADGLGGYGLNLATDIWEQKPACTWRNSGFTQGDDHPVVEVSWNDATAFCDWLSKKESKTYELPTEAEWEYACRAGTTTRFWCGDTDASLNGNANLADASLKGKTDSEITKNWTVVPWDDGYAFTSPVGHFKANPWGLYDMGGNVLQWCADGYGPYQEESNKDPKYENITMGRVLRGGSWYGVPRCRSADRDRSVPWYRNATQGFRVVLRPAAGTLDSVSAGKDVGSDLVISQAMRAIKRLGGKVLNDLNDPAKPVVAVDLGLTKVTDATMKEVAGLKGLKELNLSETAVTDVGLKELANLKRLQTLNLGGCQGVTDAGLKELAALNGLQTLYLNDTGVTDAGLMELAKLTGLQTLYLNNTKAADAGLKELAILRGLQTLNLHGCKGVTDAGLKELFDLKSLQYLDLDGTKVAGAGAELKKALPDCKIIGLQRSKELLEGGEPKYAVTTRKPSTLSSAQLRKALHGTFETASGKHMSMTFAYPEYTLNPSKDYVWAAGNVGTWEIYTDHLLLTPADKENGLVVLEMTAPDAPMTPLPAHVAVFMGNDGLVSQITFHTFLGIRFPSDKYMVLKRTAVAELPDPNPTAVTTPSPVAVDKGVFAPKRLFGKPGQL